MKPNFEQMSVPELKAYVRENRNDIEAIRALFYHPNLKWKTMPPLATKKGEPIEENIHLAEEAIREKLARAKAQQNEAELKKEREIEEKLRPKLEKEIEAKIRVKLEKEIEEKIRHKLEHEKEQDNQS